MWQIVRVQTQCLYGTGTYCLDYVLKVVPTAQLEQSVEHYCYNKEEHDNYSYKLYILVTS